MQKIVQCVPNFSEGKNIEVIKKIIAPLLNQEGFTFVSYEADPDYNRTVVTLIGEAEAMIAPLVEFFSQALNYIDMNKHHGEHARMGAVDVVPFIPISGIKMDEASSYAKELAAIVSSKFSIPIYLYAEAAQSEERVLLPNIREGEFEGMAKKMEDPKWYPDYGSNKIHPSFGVVAIGARMPLVAYNIDLDCDEVVATKLARTIRKSSGGLQYIQAGAVYLEQRGHFQVSMNILDYKKNPLYRVNEILKMEARAYQAKIVSSEVIGLIPKDAIIRSLQYYFLINNLKFNKNISLSDLSNLASKYLLFRDFSPKKIIEFYLEERNE